MILYLRTDTRAQMDAALLAAGLPVESTDAVCVDHIGPIHRVVEGNPPTVETVDARHHTNILTRFDPTDAQLAALPIIPTPDQPARAFA
jgi:hypothetical protein